MISNKLLGVLILTLLTSCKKEIENHFIPTGAKDYVVFEDGSFWIYQDSLTGIIDSVFLISTSVEMIAYNEETVNRYENISFNRFSSLKGNILQVLRCYEEYNVMHSNGYAGFYYRENMTTPYDCGMSIICYQGSIESQVCGDSTYKNVIFFRDRDENSYSYWSKHIGAIKIVRHYDLNDSLVVLNLIRYHIN